MTVSVRPVSSPRDLKAFIRLPWRLYALDKNWVPPLLSEEKKLLDRERNPFYKHAEVEFYLAERDGKVVGRIGAIVNENHNKFHEEKMGFWGFFESEKDPEIVAALFSQVETWLRGKGMTASRGPANPSMNDTCGMLVDGFEWSPFVMMTYNPRWYPDAVEELGYGKCKDLLAFMLVQEKRNLKRMNKIAGRVPKRDEIHIRRMNMRNFERELETVIGIYNDAWSRNWGFVPLTEEEIRFAAHSMKPVLLPDLALIAEYQGEAVGFALAVPDINHILKKVNGRLFPFGWLRFLKSRLRKIPTYRLITLGVKKKHQQLGIGALFYQRYLGNTETLGIVAAELSWILEDNEPMIRALKLMGSKHYKTYRMYEKSLS